VVYGNKLIETQKRMSEPVTRAERSKVMSVDEFLKSTESETQKYESVVFIHVMIDENFAANFV